MAILVRPGINRVVIDAQLGDPRVVQVVGCGAVELGYLYSITPR